jgi:dTDP-4-dehydrorhamnose reductase
MQRILITGAHGMLGSALQNALQNEFEPIAASRSELNIESFADTRAFLQKVRPDIVLHCAAYTNVEEAERNPDDCYRANYNGTLHLLNALPDQDTRFVYISSTGCYGSYKDGPYREYDTVLPTTVYHRSKYAGENAVKELASDFLILRTGWLFGGSPEHKKNFVFNRLREASKKDRLVSDPFQAGNPTNTEDVARQLQLMLDLKLKGIFNLVSEGSCTRYDYVKAIVDLSGLACEVVLAEKPFERLARVSHNEAAVNFNLSQMGICQMPHWKESLQKYIRTNLSYV